MAGKDRRGHIIASQKKKQKQEKDFIEAVSPEKDLRLHNENKNMDVTNQSSEGQDSELKKLQGKVDAVENDLLKNGEDGIRKAAAMIVLLDKEREDYKAQLNALPANNAANAGVLAKPSFFKGNWLKIGGVTLFLSFLFFYRKKITAAFLGIFSSSAAPSKKPAKSDFN